MRLPIIPNVLFCVFAVGGCALAHERPDVPDASDAFVVPDAQSPPADGGPPPDAWLGPPPVHCSEVATLIVHPPPDRTYFEHVITGDLDGDGRDEVIATSRLDDGSMGANLHVYGMSGAAMGERWRTNDGAGYAFGLRTHDVDGDGDLDVVAAWGGIRIFDNVGGTLSARETIGSGGGAGIAFDVDDYDGDGDADITHYTDQNQATLWLQEDGVFREEIVGGTPIATGLASVLMLHTPARLPARIVVASTDVAHVDVFAPNAIGWSSEFQHGASARTGTIAVGDFDGDGFEDFVLTQFQGDPPIFFRQAPNWDVSVGFMGDPAVGFALANAVVDYDRDGDDDVLLGNFVDSVLFLDESIAGFQFAEHRTVCDFASDSVLGGLYDLALGDVDGDGRRDLVVTTRAGIAIFSDFVSRLFAL